MAINISYDNDGDNGDNDYVKPCINLEEAERTKTGMVLSAHGSYSLVDTK